MFPSFLSKSILNLVLRAIFRQGNKNDDCVLDDLRITKRESQLRSHTQSFDNGTRMVMAPATIF